MRVSRAFIRPGMVGGNRMAVSAGTQARLRMQFKIRQGMRWDKVAAAVGEMNARCLKYWGKVVKNASKTGIGRGKGKITGAARRRSGSPIEFVGGLYHDITAYGSGQSRPAGQPIRSWAPKRFVYNDIVNYYDSGSKTVVIGTYKTAHWLAQLHQFGGTVRETAYRIGVRAAWNAYQRRRAGRPIQRRMNGDLDVGAIRWHIDKAGKFRGSRSWERTTMTRTARYPARPYVQDAVKVVEAVRKANIAWKNQLRKSG